MTLTCHGHAIGAVFSLNRTRGVADVWLGDARTQRIRLADVRGVPGSRPTPAEVRAELERRAGLCFGRWPSEGAAEEVGAFEVGYRAGEHI